MRMIDVEYDDFMNRLKAAATAGQRIERRDKMKWLAYIREHRVLEGACMVHGRSVSDSVVPVIIDSIDEWNGFYVYSKDEGICLKFQRDS